MSLFRKFRKCCMHQVSNRKVRDAEGVTTYVTHRCCRCGGMHYYRCRKVAGIPQGHGPHHPVEIETVYWDEGCEDAPCPGEIGS